MKRKFLTTKNKAILRRELKNYLLDVLRQEDSLDSLAKCKAEAYRVEVYGNRPFTPYLVVDWLRGLPIGVMFTTYDVVTFFCSILGIDYDTFEREYQEDACDVDDFYWKTLGEIIYFA